MDGVFYLHVIRVNAQDMPYADIDPVELVKGMGELFGFGVRPQKL